MDALLPWERTLWSQRALLRPRERYVLTDFRLLRTRSTVVDEIPLQDIAEVRLRRTWVDRLMRTSTVVVHSHDQRRSPLVLPHIRRGAPFAAFLELASGERLASWDAQSVRAVLAWEPRGWMGYREAMVGFLTVVATIVVIGVALHGTAAKITYPTDDAIAPGGVKKDRDTIARFMETDVMPWARNVLGPIRGGPDQISCETCHGSAAEERGWQMPSVTALPQPDVARKGWESFGGPMDSQIRNAIYGYIAEADNQATAAYMREVVMPGMARLLHRPPYDFTRTYDYNRSHVAFGCYHCHRVA